MEHHWSNELLKDCTNAAKALEKLAHSTGFEPVTSAFGGQRSIHTRFARGWLLRTPTLSKLIEYLGLDWDENCLSPQNNTRSVGTASNLQVRQKVYKGSSEQWKKYKPFLNGVFDQFSS